VVTGRNEGAEPGRQAQRRTLSRRLHVPTYQRRGRTFEVPIWHLKTGRQALRSLCLYRAGVAMLSTVLHSERAVRVNIEIMRAFVHRQRLIP